MVNKKFTIIGLMIAGFCITLPANADNWKVVQKIKKDKMIVYLHNKSIKKEPPYVTYTMRFKSKLTGDYINVVYANCNDFSSGIIGTYEYNDNFEPYYESIEVKPELKEIDNTSILYDTTSNACISKDSYIKQRKEKAKKTREGDSIPMKIIKGIGMTIGCIICLPLALIAMLLK